MKLRLPHLAAALAALAVIGVAVVAPASPAYAAAGVSVTVEGDPSKVGVADPNYVTQLRVTGSGFQSIKNGFGGIYVSFGWVSGDGWQPSQGGVTGEDYRYVPDDESAPTGYINFVTFPGSSTAYAANGGEIAADGSWSAVMTVPGAVFTSLDRDGNPSEVNCLEVQCGIITIGAHGVKNPSNESFTPVRFENLYGEGAAAPEVAAPADAAAPAAEPTPAPTQTVIVEEPAEAAITEVGSGNEQLITILLWVAGGVGALAVGAIAFMVWAVLSSRKRQRAAAAAPAAASVAAGDSAGPDADGSDGASS